MRISSDAILLLGFKQTTSSIFRRTPCLHARYGLRPLSPPRRSWRACPAGSRACGQEQASAAGSKKRFQVAEVRIQSMQKIMPILAALQLGLRPYDSSRTLYDSSRIWPRSLVESIDRIGPSDFGKRAQSFPGYLTSDANLSFISLMLEIRDQMYTCGRLAQLLGSNASVLSCELWQIRDRS